MPLLTENSFQRLSDPIIDKADGLTFPLLGILKEIAEQLIKNPDITLNTEQIRRQVEGNWEEYNDEAHGWVDEALPEAYLRGIQKTNGDTPRSMEANQGFSPAPLLESSGGGGDIATKAGKILDDYPRHHTMYTAFQDAAYKKFDDTRLPVVRDVQGKVRDLIIQASESAYKDADGFTRRKLSQQLMNRFADANITGIRYADGRTMKLDTYSEMVARSQTGNAARQAALNRSQEYGLDLVQISQHFPTSDLCAPWQGKVYSISGTDSKYPPLDTAVSGGLYHANCKHHQSSYIPGTSKLPDEEMTVRKNRKQYELEQTQRYQERQIRSWKRREASALTDAEAEKARQKVRQWQEKQRDLVQEHKHLRRKYAREQV